MGVSGCTATGWDWFISFVWLAGAGKGLSGLSGLFCSSHQRDQKNQMNQSGLSRLSDLSCWPDRLTKATR